MFYTVQPNFVCENCIKCGSRPVVEQNKKTWTVKCPNDACNNASTNSFADFETWNRQNTPAASIDKNGTTVKKAI